MAKKRKRTSTKEAVQKRAATQITASTISASSSRKRAVAAFKLGHKSAMRGGATVIIVPGTPGKHRLYGSKSGALRFQITPKSSATRIVERLGIKPGVVREVDSVIANLRLRKKIG